MKIFLTLFTVLNLLFAFGQDKKIIDPSVYNDWKRLEKQEISKSGKWITYEIKPHRGDGFLYLYNTETAVLDSFYRATGAKLSPNEDFLVYRKSPSFDTLRKVELKKVDKKKWPQDTLVIMNLADRQKMFVPKVKSFQLAQKGDWVTYLIDSTYTQPKAEKKEIKGLFKKRKKKKAAEIKEVKISSEGNYLFAYNTSTKDTLTFKNITNYLMDDSSSYLFLTDQEKIDKKEKISLQVFDLKTKKSSILDSSATKITQVTWNAERQVLAFLSSNDTIKEKNYVLQLYDVKDQKKYLSIDSNTLNVPKGEMVSEFQKLIFTQDNRMMFFGVAPALIKEPEDSLLANEKPVLDLWHYEDKRLQPEQLLQQKKDKEDSKIYALHLNDFHLVALENDSLTVDINKFIIGDYVLASNVLPYQQTYNWTVPNLEDHYRVNLKTGEVELLAKAIGMGGSLSPKGQLYTFFDITKEEHFIKNLSNQQLSCISCSATNVNWQTDVNGQPHTAYPFGILGLDEKEEQVYVQSEYDVWAYTIADQSLKSITGELGFKNKQKINLRIWDRDSVYITPSNSYFLGQDDKSKDELIFAWDQAKSEPRLLYRGAFQFSGIARSKNKEKIILRKGSLKFYPEVYLLDKTFANEKQVSITNPQQSEYNWAEVEIIDYKSRDGQNLQALLYRPENYDANKEYPLIVYFYELYTDEIHNHYAPRPTASIIYPTEYASAGYMVLIPDIRYKIGLPAQSAYNCIMGATDAALKKYTSIDSTRMGLQGQSWGGYQTAQLITMTNRYSAAMAGAPVSNMFSAYGGIRWGSGLNRQFQYEKTQSRIGKTIWEAPNLYTQNSPIFHLPKVKTPLLIMHNDADGAVPWYQGIELFTGMKRLGKPCWMLNYNGDDHNLLKNANRIDLSIRMRQFFDHYLQNKPAPRWLVEGIPATVKGKEMRYELLNEAK